MARDDYMLVVLKPVNGNLVIEYTCRYLQSDGGLVLFITTIR